MSVRIDSCPRHTSIPNIRKENNAPMSQQGVFSPTKKSPSKGGAMNEVSSDVRTGFADLFRSYEDGRRHGHFVHGLAMLVATGLIIYYSLLAGNWIGGHHYQVFPKGPQYATANPANPDDPTQNICVAPADCHAGESTGDRWLNVLMTIILYFTIFAVYYPFFMTFWHDLTHVKQMAGNKTVYLYVVHIIKTAGDHLLYIGIILTSVFLPLKLDDYWDLNWLWVTAPIWLGTGVYFLLDGVLGFHAVYKWFVRPAVPPGYTPPGNTA